MKSILTMLILSIAGRRIQLNHNRVFYHLYNFLPNHKTAFSKQIIRKWLLFYYREELKLQRILLNRQFS